MSIFGEDSVKASIERWKPTEKIELEEEPVIDEEDIIHAEILFEPPERKPVDYKIYVEREGKRIDVTYAATDCFDIAHNSMDFGSGFLDNEEMEHLRQFAFAIGVDDSPFRTTQQNG